MRGTAVLCFVMTIMTVSRVRAMGKYRGLEFIEPCSRRDPKLEACLSKSANTLVEHFRHGLPQLGYPEVEPIVLDEIQITLGSGPDGYKAQFKDVTATGVSNVTVTGLRTQITDNEVQLQLLLKIPKIFATAKYRSSGVLILVKASGGGDYWGEYEDVNAKVFIRAKPYTNQDRVFLKLSELKMNFNVGKINMGVKNLNDGNTILEAALNLFINSNSQELLTEMKPDLKQKLVTLMSSFVERLFLQVPYDAWIID